MSWQRIDENTYIDDTLVTCAEYQLFIDEMREQGQYYQPDHWTSYQFPAGQAQEPILGARSSDTLAFCEWLTQRDASEWRYRIPSHEEAQRFPPKVPGDQIQGYWVSGTEENNYLFTWVGTVIPPDPRNLDLASAIRIHLDQLDPSHTIAPARSADLANMVVNDLELNQALNSARASPLDIDAARALMNRFDFLPFPYELTRVLGLENTGRSLDFDGNLDQYRTMTLLLIFNLVQSHRIDVPPGFRIDYQQDRILELGICIDILTLQERIAGRSPAFEGIRLVRASAM